MVNCEIMKKSLIVMMMVLVATVAEAQFTRATLQATGLTCAMCSNAINKALQKVPFVESVRSDIKNSSFSIVFKTGMEVNADELKKAVEDAGFAIGGLKLTGNFSAVSIDAAGHAKIGSMLYHFLGAGGQVLNGEYTVSVVDKNFVTAKQFKKISAAEKAGCLETGTADKCCPGDSLAPDTRVYHVML